jgi:hypothetical protein
VRKAILALAVAVAVAAPQPAAAKLPYMSVAISPSDPAVGQRIVVTLRCFGDQEHTQQWRSCLGDGATLAWIHPLDSEGDLDRHDWLRVVGHNTPSGATRGFVTLDEPGPYVVRPLWKFWRRSSPGFPHPIRFEVHRQTSPVPVVALTITAVGLGVAILSRRRRRRVPTASGQVDVIAASNPRSN